MFVPMAFTAESPPALGQSSVLKVVAGTTGGSFSGITNGQFLVRPFPTPTIIIGTVDICDIDRQYCIGGWCVTVPRDNHKIFFLYHHSMYCCSSTTVWSPLVVVVDRHKVVYYSSSTSSLRARIYVVSFFIYYVQVYIVCG